MDKLISIEEMREAFQNQQEVEQAIVNLKGSCIADQMKDLLILLKYVRKLEESNHEHHLAHMMRALAKETK